MLKSTVLATAVIAFALGSAVPSCAGEGLFSGIQVGKNAAHWELRGGASGYDAGIFSNQHLDGFNLNAEVLAPSPGWLSRLGSPRPYLGMDIAISHTPIDVLYAGLNWEAYLTRRFYLGFSVGGAVVSRQSVTYAPGRRKDLGSPVQFHLQASAGYDFTPHLTAQVYYNHFSNAHIVEPDPGLESVGARLGYRF